MTVRRLSPPVDMCSGPLIPQLLRFAVPLMLTGVLQLLYNAADLIVVGRYTGSAALAAVGATSSLINLIINVFIGLSIGANVVIARAVGAADNARATSATHTAITVSAVCGVALGIFGVSAAGLLLQWMGTPADVLGGATLYMRIIAAGFPAALVYNFGAAVLRSNGDTRRPLYFLLVSGSINVVMNLFFVLVCGMGVAGVAVATILSQYISAVLVILALRHLAGPCRLRLHDLKIHKNDLLGIVRVGVPAGLQSACFSLSNVLIQSSINSFGSVAMAGNAAAVNLEGFVYTAMDAVAQSVLTFVGQNMGAKQYRRVPKIVHGGLLLITVVSLLLGGMVLLLRVPLLSIYAKDDPGVITYGVRRLFYICGTYYICGWMNLYSNTLRSMGYSTLPMFTCVLGVCGLRVVTIYTVFRWFHTLDVLYICYPASWIVTVLVLLIAYRILYRRLLKRTEGAGDGITE